MIGRQGENESGKNGIPRGVKILGDIPWIVSKYMTH
jgi:hypothetical protein